MPVSAAARGTLEATAAAADNGKVEPWLPTPLTCSAPTYAYLLAILWRATCVRLADTETTCVMLSEDGKIN